MARTESRTMTSYHLITAIFGSRNLRWSKCKAYESIFVGIENHSVAMGLGRPRSGISCWGWCKPVAKYPRDIAAFRCWRLTRRRCKPSRPWSSLLDINIGASAKERTYPVRLISLAEAVTKAGARNTVRYWWLRASKQCGRRCACWRGTAEQATEYRSRRSVSGKIEIYTLTRGPGRTRSCI